MKIKILEVRDRMTFIPVMATLVEADNEEQRWLLARVGFVPTSYRHVILTRLSDQESHADHHDWSRTLRVAHSHIREHFDDLADGDVVDVEHVLGETETMKVSERIGG